MRIGIWLVAALTVLSGTASAHGGMAHADSYRELMLTFANNINTIEGGTHLTGFRSGLTRCLNDYARRAGILKEADANLSGEDVREGLVAVVSVKLPNPKFESQTKVKLSNTEVEGVVQQIPGYGKKVRDRDERLRYVFELLLDWLFLATFSGGCDDFFFVVLVGVEKARLGENVNARVIAALNNIRFTIQNLLCYGTQ